MRLMKKYGAEDEEEKKEDGNEKAIDKRDAPNLTYVSDYEKLIKKKK